MQPVYECTDVHTHRSVRRTLARWLRRAPRAYTALFEYGETNRRNLPGDPAPLEALGLVAAEAASFLIGSVGSSREMNNVDHAGQLDLNRAREELMDLLVLTRAFSASSQDDDQRQQCADILEREVAGSWHNRRLPDPLLGKMFWNNLFRRDGKKLRWRSELVRQAGRECVDQGADS